MHVEMMMKDFSECFSFLLLVLFASHVQCSSDQVPLQDYTCQHPPYTIHLFSKAPLVIYISNFLTASERTHLQEITYVPSKLPLLRPKLTTPQKRHLRPLRRRRRDRTRRSPPNPNLAIHFRSSRPHSPLHRNPRPPLPRIRHSALPPGAPPTRAIRKRRALSLTHRLVHHR